MNKAQRAKSNRPVFDQRGQKIGQQINIAGDANGLVIHGSTGSSAIDIKAKKLAVAAAREKTHFKTPGASKAAPSPPDMPKTTAKPLPTTTATGQRILFIGAHCDDIEIGCGGTAAKRVAAGQAIAFAVAADCGADRKAEAKAAAAILKLNEASGNLFFGLIPDGRLAERQDVLQAWLKNLVERFQPDTVFVHHGADAHPDHETLYRVAIRVFVRENMLLYPIPKLAAQAVPFQASQYEDISKFIHAKLKLCACHLSQADKGIYLDPEQIKDTARITYRVAYGKSGGYAEAFHIHVMRSGTSEQTRPPTVRSVNPAAPAEVNASEEARKKANIEAKRIAKERRIPKCKPREEEATPQDNQRRIDAVAPSRAALGQTIDVLVQVRRLSSPPLGLEDWPFKRKVDALETDSRKTDIEFPKNPTSGQPMSAKLRVRLVAPNFGVSLPREKILIVPPEGDSEILSFLLTTKTRGLWRINVEIFSFYEEHIGTIPVETIVNGSVTDPQSALASLTLGIKVSDTVFSPLQIWREKLEFLLVEEAKSASPAQIFELQQLIKEARTKITELENERPALDARALKKDTSVGGGGSTMPPTPPGSDSEANGKSKGKDLDDSVWDEIKKLVRDNPPLGRQILAAIKPDDGTKQAVDALYGKVCKLGMVEVLGELKEWLELQSSLENPDDFEKLIGWLSVLGINSGWLQGKRNQLKEKTGLSAQPLEVPGPVWPFSAELVMAALQNRRPIWDKNGDHPSQWPGKDNPLTALPEDLAGRSDKSEERFHQLVRNLLNFLLLPVVDAFEINYKNLADHVKRRNSKRHIYIEAESRRFGQDPLLSDQRVYENLLVLKRDPAQPEVFAEVTGYEEVLRQLVDKLEIFKSKSKRP